MGKMSWRNDNGGLKLVSTLFSSLQGYRMVHFLKPFYKNQFERNQD
jgi:hypothetical protein